MPLFFLRLILCLLLVDVVASPALAQQTRACCRSEEKDDWYFQVDGGVAMLEDYDLTRTSGGPITTLSSISFDPGFAMGAHIGYRFNPYFRLEGEVSYHLHNEVEATNVANIDNEAGQRTTSAMANIYLDYPNRYYITPFIGVGAGARYIKTPIRVSLTSGPTTIEQRIPEALVFGYQFMTGLAYEFRNGVFNHKSEILLEYRYIGSATGKDESDVVGGYYNTFEHQAHLLMLGWRIYF